MMRNSSLSIPLKETAQEFPDANTIHAGRFHVEPARGRYVRVGHGAAGFDALRAQKTALARKVAYVPGNSFFPDTRDGMNSLRLNFTLVPEEKIRAGLGVLGDAFAAELAA